MLRGTAITRAMSDETTVPKMNGRAPNRSLTGSHSLLNRKRQQEREPFEGAIAEFAPHQVFSGARGGFWRGGGGLHVVLTVQPKLKDGEREERDALRPSSRLKLTPGRAKVST